VVLESRPLLFVLDYLEHRRNSFLCRKPYEHWPAIKSGQKEQLAIVIQVEDKKHCFLFQYGRLPFMVHISTQTQLPCQLMFFFLGKRVFIYGSTSICQGARTIPAHQSPAKSNPNLVPSKSLDLDRTSLARSPDLSASIHAYCFFQLVRELIPLVLVTSVCPIVTTHHYDSHLHRRFVVTLHY
jgi:hypothetical protein